MTDGWLVERLNPRSIPVIGFDEISARLPTFKGMPQGLVWRRQIGVFNGGSESAPDFRDTPQDEIVIP